jgi:hypothetical protein
VIKTIKPVDKKIVPKPQAKPKEEEDSEYYSDSPDVQVLLETIRN